MTNLGKPQWYFPICLWLACTCWRTNLRTSYGCCFYYRVPQTYGILQACLGATFYEMFLITILYGYHPTWMWSTFCNVVNHVGRHNDTNKWRGWLRPSSRLSNLFNPFMHQSATNGQGEILARASGHGAIPPVEVSPTTNGRVVQAQKLVWF